jgi:hypothetical protein
VQLDFLKGEELLGCLGHTIEMAGSNIGGGSGRVKKQFQKGKERGW